MIRVWRLVAALFAACTMSACGSSDNDPVPAPPPVDTCYWGASAMLFFKAGATLDEVASKRLDQMLADWRLGGGRFAITGHADTTGSSAANMAMSLQRANGIKAYLVRGGVPAAAIGVSGKGDRQLLIQTGAGVSEPQNRRAEVMLRDNTRTVCGDRIRKPFEDWYARNCTPAAKPGRAEACATMQVPGPHW